MPISRNKPPPPPENLSLLTPAPPDPSTLSFSLPVRKLLSPSDLELFQASPTHGLLLSFVTDLNNSVINKPNSSEITITPVIEKILTVLDAVNSFVDEFPAEDTGGSRFGNKGFQQLYDAIWERSDRLHGEIGISEEAREELGRYFQECWGNRTRIDYGSGHELNFIAWL
jgi:serine/threonine-protein phosphatase 2A activator